MMLTPCGPSAVPTGGAGVAAPAFSCTFTTAAIFFFLGAILYGSFSCWSGSVRPGSRSWGPPSRGTLDLGDLVEGELDRGLPAEDGHEHLELLGVGVDLVHRRGERGERAIHHRNGLADLVFHGGPAHRLGLRGLLLGLGRSEEHTS